MLKEDKTKAAIIAGVFSLVGACIGGVFLFLTTIMQKVDLPIKGLSGGGNPAAEQRTILFKDDFSDPKSGWDRVQEVDKVTDYVNGGYRIYVNDTQTDNWSNPGKYYKGDVSVEVDAAKLPGTDDNDFGLICRYSYVNNNHNFYYFLISSDGFAGIGRMKDGDRQLISADEMQPAGVIKQGASSNHIRADCISNSLTLYVNGVQVASINDISFSEGDVGLMAGAYEVSGVDILFDNFVVYNP
jgi:hypothetical protein